MDMAISSVSTTVSQQTISSGQGKTGEGQAFQQALVQQIAGTTTEGTAQAQSSAAAQSVSPSVLGLIEFGDSVDLKELIDQLIAELDVDLETDTDAAGQEQLTELADMLDQMNALLSLLGVPLNTLQTAAAAYPNADNVNAGTSANVDGTIAAAKGHLQDALLHMQSILEQGTTKLVQNQEPSALIGQQVQSLQQLLAKQADSRTQNSITQKPNLDGQANLIVVVSAAASSSEALLQRLSRQSIHPAVLDGAKDSIAVAGIAVLNVNAMNAKDVNSLMSMQLTTELQDEAGAAIDFESAAANASNQETTSAFHLSLTDSVKANLLEATKAASQQTYVSVDKFAESMQNLIVQKFDISTLAGGSEAKIILFPEHLGQVDVKITMQNGQLTAVFQTDTPVAKEMLDNQMAQLRQSLQAQGLTVDKLEVSYGQSAQGLGQGQQGSKRQQHSSTNRSQNGGSHAATSIEGGFETELVEQAVNRGLGFGRGISVRA